MDFLRKINLDDVFAYPTVKIVKVKDRYLGLIRYAFLLAIFIYIVVYVVIMNHGYNKCIVPNGSIGLSLKKPTANIDPFNYNYCLQYNQSNNYGISDPLNCMVMDENDAYYPVDQTSAMFITTRFSQLLQVKNCSGINDGCYQPWATITNSTAYTGDYYYSAAIENFTIRLSHFFQAREYFLDTLDNYYSQSCAEMTGKLLDVHGHTIQEYGNNETDIISVDLLLKASNTNLNQVSDNALDSLNNESFRHAGIVIFFGIDYSNEYQSNVEYTYTVTRVPTMEYKVDITSYIGINQRLNENRHGIKIFFIFSGNICKFDFQTLLIQLVSGLGLLGIATVTTDLLMSYCMPLRKAYNKYKYQSTKYHTTIKRQYTEQGSEAFDEYEHDIDVFETVNRNKDKNKNKNKNGNDNGNGGVDNGYDNNNQSTLDKLQKNKNKYNGNPESNENYRAVL